MPIPSTFADLTPVASTNSPQGSESVKGTIDDYLRVHAALICQLYNQLLGPTVTLASAATVQIGFAAALNIAITGTTTITAFDTIAEGTLRWVTFAGALTLTHDAAKLQLPGAANIQTAAGDAALFKSLGGGNWKCLDFQRASGYGVIPALPLTGGALTGQLILKEGTAAAPGLTFANDGSYDTGLYHPADGNMGVACNGNPNVLWYVGGQKHYGTLDQITTGANGSQRGIVRFNQANGTLRYQFGLESDERPVLWSYNTSGVFDGAVHFGSGNVTADGVVSGSTVMQTSDERKKKRWRRLPGDFIAKLAGIRKAGTFHWKKGGGACVGIGAQSLEAILPEAVHTDDKGGKTVNTGGAALAILAEVARELVQIRARIAKLEAR